MPKKVWIVLVGALVTGCATAPQMGVRSDLSVSTAEFCDHRVPSDVCTLHNPELVDRFKAVNDWCPEHGVPESQCHKCHADLSFEPLPTLPEGADFKKLSMAGEDVGPLEPLAVAGKVTIFDFYADWCMPCRTIDVHLFKKLQTRQDLAVRKLNIVDWDTPIVQRHLTNVKNLPYLVIYGVDGKRSTVVTGADLDVLDAAIARAAAP